MAKLPTVTTTRGAISVELLLQPRPAGLDLLGTGVPVVGRAALDHVGDVEAVAGQAHLLQHQLVEELAGAAHEGLPEAVLLRAGALAHEEQVGVGVADPEDDLRAGLGQAATHAGGGFGRDHLEVGGHRENATGRPSGRATARTAASTARVASQPTRSTAAGTRPVAAATRPSPSTVVCTGTSARERPPWPARATRWQPALSRSASVTITPMVVLPYSVLPDGVVDRNRAGGS